MNTFRMHSESLMIPLSYYVIAQRGRLLHRAGRRSDPPQHHHHFALRGIDAECDQHQLRRIFTILHNVAGQVFVFFALTVAAAEVAVGLAIIIALHRAKPRSMSTNFSLMKW